VGRIIFPEVDDAALSDYLRQAQVAGFDLVYWMTSDDRIPNGALLERFRGQLVDRKVTYAVSLASLCEPDSLVSSQFRIEEYPREPASLVLKSLSLDSGVYSRFRVDPRIPSHIFQDLYETWIDRSTRREIADTVLTAVMPDGTIVGLLTIAIVGQECQIGLLSVDGSRRRIGIAKQLMNVGHRWIAARAIERVSVVTQGDNREACAFYERCGYRMRDRKNIFHFWPQQRLSL